MDLPACVDALNRMIRPQSFPLGMKIYKDAGHLPEKAVRPAKYGIRISLCQWTTTARRWGHVLGAVAEDVNCSPCLAALGLRRLEDPGALAAYFMEMGFFENPELAARAVGELDPIPFGEIGAVAVFPLDKAPVAPDVVVIYGTPAQMSRLAAGWVYHHGETIRYKTNGFGISCMSALKPHFSGKPAFVHPGRGERILAGTDDAEMFLTLPAGDLEALVDGLEKTHAKGTRYPMQSYLLYEPPLLKPMQKLAGYLKEE